MYICMYMDQDMHMHVLGAVCRRRSMDRRRDSRVMDSSSALQLKHCPGSSPLGPVVGSADGAGVGASVGSAVGPVVGALEGGEVGPMVGESVGKLVGEVVDGVGHMNLQPSQPKNSRQTMQMRPA